MNPTNLPSNYPRGFTLPELLISLSIVAILAAIAVPGFERSVQTQQASSVMQSLQDQLELARHMAISSNRQVVICTANRNASRCVESRDWSGALLSFIDANHNAQLDAGDKLISSIPLLAEQGQVSSNANGYLSFDPFGNLAGIGKSFRYCPENASTRMARGLSVNAQGRYRVWRDSNGNGIVDFNGHDIDC